jgi:hypothetical protein
MIVYRQMAAAALAKDRHRGLEACCCLQWVEFNRCVPESVLADLLRWSHPTASTNSCSLSLLASQALLHAGILLNICC